jgi:hypothetical protein
MSVYPFSRLIFSGLMSYRGSAVGTSGWSGSTLSDRDQRQTHVADLLEQAIQRGLVDHRALDEGGAVVLVGDGQSVEPAGPSGIQVPLEADFVRSVRSHARKVGTDVVSGHHHVW